MAKLNTMVLMLHFSLFAEYMTEDLNTLQLVHVLYRHGDRTPVRTYPKDPYRNESLWPVGWGQLTNKGKEDQYNLGKYLRKYYSGFLSEMYDPKEIYIRSTDVDRTLMSAYTNLAGLYEPEKSQIWNRNISWQPIPVHTVTETKDHLLSMNANCPRYYLELQKVFNCPQIQELNKKYAEMYHYLTINTGLNVTNVTVVQNIYDTLYIEQIHKFQLPQWTKSVFPEKMQYLADLSFVLLGKTTVQRRLFGGPLVAEVVKHMEMKRNGSLGRKFFMYSAHDTTVAGFLSAMGVFKVQHVPYACLVMVELHRDSQNNYGVKVLYRNSTEADPYVMILPNCTELCPLDKYIALTKLICAEDPVKECFRQPEPSVAVFTGITSAVITSSLLGFTLILSIIVGLICWQKNRTTPYRYFTLQTE